MAALLAAIQPVIDALITAGVSATGDPRNAHPPCALVSVESMTPRTATGLRAELVIVLIAPGAPNFDALTWLDSALDKAWQALEIRSSAGMGSYSSPHVGTDLLALELRVPLFDYEYEGE